MNPNKINSKKPLKFCLLILFSLVIALVAYQALIYPYLQQGKQIVGEIKLVDQQKEELSLQMEKAQTCHEDLAALQLQIQSEEQDFFTIQTQEEMIVLLDSLASNREILLDEIGFSKSSIPIPAMNSESQLGLDALNITLFTTGSYDNNLRFIQSIESAANNLTISNFEIHKQTDSLFQLELSLVLYTVSSTSIK